MHTDVRVKRVNCSSYQDYFSLLVLRLSNLSGIKEGNPEPILPVPAAGRGKWCVPSGPPFESATSQIILSSSQASSCCTSLCNSFGRIWCYIQPSRQSTLSGWDEQRPWDETADNLVYQFLFLPRAFQWNAYVLVLWGEVTCESCMEFKRFRLTSVSKGWQYSG